MSVISIVFAELHTPLFLAGKNFGSKLQPNQTSGLTLFYNRKEKELIVVYNGQGAIIPAPSIASMTPADPKDLGLGVQAEVEKVTTTKAAPVQVQAPKAAPVQKHHPQTSNINKAQVSDPSSGGRVQGEG